MRRNQVQKKHIVSSVLVLNLLEQEIKNTLCDAYLLYLPFDCSAGLGDPDIHCSEEERLKEADSPILEEPNFTSKELDPDTGLYYFNARYYDAALGRFITADPIRDGLNWYMYTYNNPVIYIDPTGLRPVEDVVQLVGNSSGQLTYNEQTDTYYDGTGAVYTFDSEDASQSSDDSQLNSDSDVNESSDINEEVEDFYIEKKVDQVLSYSGKYDDENWREYIRNTVEDSINIEKMPENNGHFGAAIGADIVIWNPFFSLKNIFSKKENRVPDTYAVTIAFFTIFNKNYGETGLSFSIGYGSGFPPNISTGVKLGIYVAPPEQVFTGTSVEQGVSVGFYEGAAILSDERDFLGYESTFGKSISPFDIQAFEVKSNYVPLY